MTNLSHYKLRPLEHNDANMVLYWRNSEHVKKFMYTDHTISSDEHKEWINQVISNPEYEYLIFEYNNTPIGLVGFYEISKLHKRCSWAFYLGDINAPKGSGRKMEYHAINHIFKDGEIEKLCCEVFSFNKKVIDLHKFFGFEEEGTLKSHFIKNDKAEDIKILALFRKSWQNIKASVRENLNNKN